MNIISIKIALIGSWGYWSNAASFHTLEIRLTGHYCDKSKIKLMFLPMLNSWTIVTYGYDSTSSIEIIAMILNMIITPQFKS